MMPLVWYVPDVSDNLKFLYIFVTLSVYFFFHSMFAVPYNALGYEMTSNYDEKTKIFAWKKEKESLVSFTYNYKKRKMSQKMENYYLENGAIYIFNVKEVYGRTCTLLYMYIDYVTTESETIKIEGFTSFHTRSTQF